MGLGPVVGPAHRQTAVDAVIPMDKHTRVDHLLALLGSQKDLVAHLEAHRAKLESHHASKERDRAITQTAKALRRADKELRGLERAVRNEKKRAT